MEKYSSGRRGAPAKGVGRVTGARVQIPLSPPRKHLTILLGVFIFFIIIVKSIIDKYHILDLFIILVYNVNIDNKGELDL